MNYLRILPELINATTHKQSNSQKKQHKVHKKEHRDKNNESI